MWLNQNIPQFQTRNEIQQVETKSHIYQFEIIQNSLYYLEDNKLVIYDLENKVIQKEFQFNSILTTFVVKGNNIFIAQFDKNIIQFNIITQKKKIITHCKEYIVKKMAIFNNLLFYIKYDLAQLCIIDLNFKKTIRSIQSSEDYGWDLKVSSSQNKLIAVTYADWVYSVTKIYDLENLSLFSSFQSGFYYSLVEFSIDQKHLFIANMSIVRQYNIRTRELIFEICDDLFYGMQLHQSELVLLQGQKIKFINFKQKHEIQQLALQNQLIYLENDENTSTSGEFLNVLRVSEKYTVWKSSKYGKGFNVLKKF